MKIKKLSVTAICFLLPLLFFGQIKVTEFIQYSNTANESDNTLFFVDFWATWCAPCIHVSKYLSVLQKQYPNDLYIVSLTQENPDIVKRFLKKHKIDLTIAIDYNGEAFKKYQINSMPEGILFNTKGKVLWKGHPADFKKSDVEKYLRYNRNQVPLSNIFKIQNVANNIVKNTNYKPKLDFEIFEIPNTNLQEIEVINSKTLVELKGSLQNILAYIFKVNRSQIKIDSKLNKKYHMYFKKNKTPIGNKLKEIKTALNLNYNNSNVEGEALVLDIENPTFWDNKQIDWGSDNYEYLISDNQIQADNVTFKDIIYKLSSVLELPVVVSYNEIDNDEHDWQIHYKFFSLMQTDLFDNYGIMANKKLANYPEYIITKKTP